MSAALLTSDTPRWLVLALVAVVVAAYAACAVLSLIGRTRRGLARRRQSGRPALARDTASGRQEVTS